MLDPDRPLPPADPKPIDPLDRARLDACASCMRLRGTVPPPALSPPEEEPAEYLAEPAPPVRAAA